ncbi:hypothetical protein [Nostoc sp. 2RC]|uniref:hypothetical protein n=1 Tax=Nostoc sp. 2RC TaxID=2485484 RepID=UPI0016267FD2|nr:hypothetical protein [Nostoc sp. 2RC]MBC1235923.1 hypothetical protein [Nostoc sp. 2RC]
MNHKEWYQQRYGRLSKELSLSANKAEEYQKISDHNRAKKQSLEDAARVIFREHNISYQENTNSWLCTVEGCKYYYFPKSGKWRPQGKTKIYYSRGAADFLGKVWRFHNSN